MAFTPEDKKISEYTISAKDVYGETFKGRPILGRDEDPCG